MYHFFVTFFTWLSSFLYAVLLRVFVLAVFSFKTLKDLSLAWESTIFHNNTAYWKKKPNNPKTFLLITQDEAVRDGDNYSLLVSKSPSSRIHLNTREINMAAVRLLGHSGYPEYSGDFPIIQLVSRHFRVPREANKRLVNCKWEKWLPWELKEWLKIRSQFHKLRDSNFSHWIRWWNNKNFFKLADARL